VGVFVFAEIPFQVFSDAPRFPLAFVADEVFDRRVGRVSAVTRSRVVVLGVG
jgi:hypothetical protein